MKLHNFPANVKHLTRVALSGILLAASPMIGFAQGPAIAAPISNWTYLDHSSTLQEGTLRGQAAYLSAAGELSYLDSIASINYEEAYRRAIDNSVALTRAYYERREIREEFMRKYGPRAFVGEARKRAIEAYQPKRLSTEDFNPQNGGLNWPHILRHERYAPLKEQIDKVFAARTGDNSGDGSPTQTQIKQLCDALVMLMRENISTVTPDQYIAAREFLRSVDLEAKTVLVKNKALADDQTNEDDKPAVPSEAVVIDPT